MKAKDKASELINKFHNIRNLNNYEVKQCALIAVDEMIEAIEGMVDEGSGYSCTDYYKEVKTEIEKL